jgi:hypothetical protein
MQLAYRSGLARASGTAKIHFEGQSGGIRQAPVALFAPVLSSGFVLPMNPAREHVLNADCCGNY